MNSRRRTVKARVAVVPAEQIIVACRFPAGGFHEAEAWEESPVEIVVVGCLQESAGVILCGTAGFDKKAMQRVEARVIAVVRRLLRSGTRLQGSAGKYYEPSEK